jgi:hypothetical protein
MALPKPNIQVHEVVEGHSEAFSSFDSFTRMHVFVHAHENLSADESDAYFVVREVLASKKKKGVRLINMKDVIAYFVRKKVVMTELVFRKLINKFEYEEIGKTYFEIENGSLPWVHADALRAAAIQKKDAGALERPGAWPN